MGDNRARIARLHRRGLTTLEIAHELRISQQAVYKHLKALGLKPHSRRSRERASA